MADTLLDSGILILHLLNHSGYPELTASLMDEGIAYISAMTRLEIVRGIRERERNMTYNLLNSLVTLSMDVEIADLAGEFLRSWRVKGVILGEADAVIAATAVQNNLTLVTTNPRHFPMPELKVLQADEKGALTPRT